MTDKKNAPGRQTGGKNKTRRAATTTSAANVHDAPATRKQSEVNWLFEFAESLSDRLLTLWALELRDVGPFDNYDSYLWSQYMRVELRRRHRAGGAS